MMRGERLRGSCSPLRPARRRAPRAPLLEHVCRRRRAAVAAGSHRAPGKPSERTMTPCPSERASSAVTSSSEGRRGTAREIRPAKRLHLGRCHRRLAADRGHPRPIAHATMHEPVGLQLRVRVHHGGPVHSEVPRQCPFGRQPEAGRQCSIEDSCSQRFADLAIEWHIAAAIDPDLHVRPLPFASSSRAPLGSIQSHHRRRKWPWQEPMDRYFDHPIEMRLGPELVCVMECVARGPNVREVRFDSGCAGKA